VGLLENISYNLKFKVKNIFSFMSLVLENKMFFFSKLVFLILKLSPIFCFPYLFPIFWEVIVLLSQIIFLTL